MTDLTIIGAGEVFRNRYLAAVSEVRKQYSLVISDIVDSRSSSTILAEIQSQEFDFPIRIHQLSDTTPEGLVNLLKRENLFNNPVIIATPSPVHVPYALALLEQGMTVCIEKPFAASRMQVSQFDQVITQLGTDRLFLLGYYALEKGLAALVLARGGNVPQSYLNLLMPSVEPQLIAGIRSSLGKVRNVRAVLLEGSGTAGRLNQRSWVLEPSSGGNTVETFYHLVCMALPFLGDRNGVRISNVELARHKPTSQWFFEISGQQTAETLTVASLYTDDAVEARLVCAKYVPENLHERWMEVEFDNGRAFADFESGNVDIEGRNLKLSLNLRYPTKYVTQFALLAEKLCIPHLITEYELFRDALLLTLDIREQGLQNGLGKYDTEDITRDRLEAMLGLQSR
jgi:predicted dehydrogenase